MVEVVNFNPEIMLLHLLNFPPLRIVGAKLSRNCLLGNLLAALMTRARQLIHFVYCQGHGVCPMHSL